jgi:predicted RNA-binding protein YlqC (UPF0109 family)
MPDLPTPILFAYMVRALVDKPDEVRVESQTTGDRTILRLIVAPMDMSHVVGIGGRMARCLRIFLMSVSRKEKHSYTLDLVP